MKQVKRIKPNHELPDFGWWFFLAINQFADGKTGGFVLQHTLLDQQTRVHGAGSWESFRTRHLLRTSGLFMMYLTTCCAFMSSSHPDSISVVITTNFWYRLTVTLNFHSIAEHAGKILSWLDVPLRPTSTHFNQILAKEDKVWKFSRHIHCQWTRGFLTASAWIADC